MPDGRFAPSPTGDLHLGNLRTAMVAWLFARSTGSRFIVQDGGSRPRHLITRDTRHAQLTDLAAIGIDHDGEVVRQSERFDFYRAVIADLERAGLTYPCFCTRREIRDAAVAPHGDDPDGAYPGTCRDLGDRRARRARGRPAVRRRCACARTVRWSSSSTLLHGPTRGRVDDFVLRRNDGVPAYNLAVVVDDAAQGIGQVVRGDDLLSSTPRQIHLARLLGLAVPSYAHVPLAAGDRTARAWRSATARSRSPSSPTHGIDPAEVRSRLAITLGLAVDGESVGMLELVDRFDPRQLPRAPWTYQEDQWLSTPP